MKVNVKSKGNPLILIAVFGGLCAAFFLMDKVEDIPDSNGPDDLSLTVITEQNILDMDLGSTGIKTGTSNTKVLGVNIDNEVKISADNFSGVYEIGHTYYLGSSDVYVTFTNFQVTGGNLKFVVVNEDKIIYTIEPGEPVDVLLEDLTGNVSFRLAGESAAFQLVISKSNYESIGGSE